MQSSQGLKRGILVVALGLLLGACGGDDSGDCGQDEDCGEKQVLTGIEKLWMARPGGELIAAQSLGQGPSSPRRLLILDRQGRISRVLAPLEPGRQIEKSAVFPSLGRLIFEEGGNSLPPSALQSVDLQTGEKTQLSAAPRLWTADVKADRVFLVLDDELIVLDAATGLKVASHTVAVQSMVLGTQGWLRVLSEGRLLTLAPPYDRFRVEPVRVLNQPYELLAADDRQDRVFLETREWYSDTALCFQDPQKAECFLTIYTSSPLIFPNPESSLFYVNYSEKIPLQSILYPKLVGFDPRTLKTSAAVQINTYDLQILFDPDGSLLVAGGYDLLRFDPITMRVRGSLALKEGLLGPTVFDPEGRRQFRIYNETFLAIDLDTLQIKN